MKLIPVNGKFDFKAFVSEIKNAGTGLDYQNFLRFFEDDSIVLAFVGQSHAGSRISSALGEAMLTHEGTSAIAKARSIAIAVYYSPMADDPLRVEEIQSIPGLMALLPYSGELIWNMLPDNALENNIMVRVFVKI